MAINYPKWTDWGKGRGFSSTTMGARAVERLIRSIEGKSSEVEELLLSNKLVLRETTG